MSISGFFRWWFGELGGLLPAWLRKAIRPQPPTLRFDVTEAGVTARHEVAGRSREMGSWRTPLTRNTAAPKPAVPNPYGQPDDAVGQLEARLASLRAARTRLLITVSPPLCLLKTIELPAAADENLAEVLSFEIERLTPFRRDEVYFSYRRAHRDLRSGAFSVELGVVPRRLIDAVLEPVAAWRPRPVPESSEADGPRSTEAPHFALTLLPTDYRADRARVNLALAALNAVLLVALVSVPLWRQHRELAELRVATAHARAGAEATAEMRARLDRYRAKLHFLAAKRADRPAAVEVLEELTRVLPDSTWLYRFVMNGHTIQILGISAGASSLISRLDHSDMFHGVRFASPVTQDPRSGRERFHLAAEIAPGRLSGQ